MKYVIFGAGGQVGQRLCAAIPGRHLTRQDCDIMRHDQVDKAVKGMDWAINAAAFTNVDEAEKRGLNDPAVRVNSYGVCVLAESCKAHGVKLCHISTDQVFSGSPGNGCFSVDDKTNPVNVYGESKLIGEYHARLDPRNLIVRTSWVYGGKSSFVTKVLEWATRLDHLKIVSDQFSRPTYAKDLAEAIKSMTENGAIGTVHYANEGYCSKAEFAEKILWLAAIEYRRVEHVPSSTFAGSAPRPTWAVLELAKLEGIENHYWDDSLNEYMTEAGLYGWCATCSASGIVLDKDSSQKRPCSACSGSGRAKPLQASKHTDRTERLA